MIFTIVAISFIIYFWAHGFTVYFWAHGFTEEKQSESHFENIILEGIKENTAYIRNLSEEEVVIDKIYAGDTSEDVNIPISKKDVEGVSFTASEGDEVKIVTENGTNVVFRCRSSTGTQYLMDEDFEDVSDWTETSGSCWRIESGTYVAGGICGGEHRSFSGEETWDNYTIEVDADLLTGQGYGIYFRVTNVGSSFNGYAFQYDPGYGSGAFLMRRIDNGYERSPFAIAWFPGGYQIYNIWRHIRIEINGDNFKAYVDGVLVVDANESTYSEGAIGLRMWGHSHVMFDNFRVQ